MKSRTNPFHSPAFSGAAIVFACFTLLNTGAQAADKLWIGGVGNDLLTNGSNWVGGSSPAAWDSYVFGSDVASGAMNDDAALGVSGITLTSDLTQDITITGAGLILYAQAGDGSINMSSAGANLTISGNYAQWGSAGALWNVGPGRTLTIATTVDGSADGNVFGITKSGAGTAVITGTSNMTGATTISGGSLEIGGAGTLVGGSYAGNISNAGAFVHSSTAAQTLSGIISGAGSLTQSGTGTLTLSNAGNGYTGATTVSSGTLEIGGAGTLGNGSYAGDISIGGALLYSSSANQTLSGIITGSGSITMSGSGTLTLTQATNGYPVHLFDGAVTINSGTLVAADVSFGLNFTSSITVNGGTLNMQTAPSELGNLILNGGTVTSTGLADASYGNILLSQNSTAVHAGGAAVSTISVNQVNLWGANSIDVGAGSTLNITSVVAEYGPAGLNKTGAGTLALSGANTYSGTTTVTGGMLSLGQVNSNNESSTVSITASAGAKLDLAFIGTDTVGSLFINGVQQPAGNYTSAHASGAFTGGGTLSVASGPAGYASWKAVNAPTGTPSDDYDGDGVGNGSEYVLGGTKDTNDLSKLPAISTGGANMVFTFQRAQASIDGTTNVAIQVSTNLSTWPVSYNVPGTAQANNPGVTVVKDTSAGFDTVTLTMPRTPDAAKFARLVVTPAP